MKNVTLIASNEIVLSTESGTVTYPKGSVVHLEQDSNDELFISYHEADEEKVHAFELEVTTKAVLEGILANCVILEAELDNKITFEERTLDQLIIEEGLSSSQISCYLTEVSFKKRDVVKNENNTTIQVPVRNRSKTLTAGKRATMFGESAPMTRNESATKQNIKSLDINETTSLSNSFLDVDYMFGESLEFVSIETAKTLESILGDRAKVMISESGIKVRLLQAEEAELIEALNQANINYTIEGDESLKVITLVKPVTESVVVSHYDELNEKKDDEDDDSDNDDDSNSDDNDDEDDDKKKNKKEGDDSDDDDDNSDDDDEDDSAIDNLKKEIDDEDDDDKKDKLKGKLKDLETAKKERVALRRKKKSS